MLDELRRGFRTGNDVARALHQEDVRGAQMSIVYKGRVFSVEVENARFPNGTEHKVEIVRHRPSVVLIPIQGDGRVVMIRQYRHSVKRDAVGTAGREHRSPASLADAAAARECEEEIGLVPHRLDHLASLFPSPGYCDEEMHLLSRRRICVVRRPARRTSRTRTRTSRCIRSPSPKRGRWPPAAKSSISRRRSR